MTMPSTEAKTQLVTSVVRAVTASEIVAYRKLVRSAITTREPDEHAMKASPIHAFVLAAPAFDEAVGVLSATGSYAPEAVVIHLSQEIRLQRLVQPDERVTIHVNVLGARRDPRGVRLALRAVLVGGGGSPFAELVTGVLLIGATALAPFGDIPAHPTYGSAAKPTLVTRRVSTAMIRRYAETSGDDNPIHLDPEAARAAGLPGIVAHGMSTMALVCEEVIDRYASGNPAQIRSIGGRFSSPVLPEDPLHIRLQPDDDGRIVRFSCKTPHGLALKGGWVEIMADARATAFDTSAWTRDSHG